MSTITFCMNELAVLAEHTRVSRERSPHQWQLMDKRYWYSGLGLSKADVLRAKGEHIDLQKIPAGFWLINSSDEGVYMMSNGRPGLRLSGNSDLPDSYHRVYATGNDDRVKPAVGEVSMFLPLDWYDSVRQAGKPDLVIDLGEDGSVGLIS